MTPPHSRRRHPLVPLFTAIIGVALYLAVFYPGLMTPDSATQWLEARTGSYTNAHPVLMALVWSLTETVLPGPGGLFALHLLLFWGALGWAAYELFDRRWLQIVFMLVIGFWPPVSNVVAHLWKDVPMLAFTILAVAAMARDLRVPSRICLVTAVVALSLASAYRHNALPLAIPFLWLVVRRWPKPASGSLSSTITSSRQWLSTGALTLLVAVAAAIPNRLPQVADRPVWPLTAVWDLVAISTTIDQLLVPQSWCVGEPDLDDLREAFQPWSNTPVFATNRLRISLFGETSPAQLADLRRAWTSAIAHYPSAYLKHRLRLSAMLLGLPTANTVPANLRFSPAQVFQISENPPIRPRKPHAQHLWQAAGDRLAETVVFKGWAYLLIGAMLAVLAWRRPGHTMAGVVLASAALCLAPLPWIAPSAEFRYLIWPVVAVLVAAFLRMSGESWSPANKPGH